MSDQVETVAGILRDEFIRCRRETTRVETGIWSEYKPGPSADGGRSASGRRFHPIWPKVAKIVIEHGFNPRDYVRALFYQRPLGSPIPDPRFLGMQLAVERYLKYRDRIEVQIRIALDSEEQCYASCLRTAIGLYEDRESAVRFVLLDRSCGLSPLFRYLVATREQLDDLRDHWRPRAARQYRDDLERYEKWWGRVLSDAVRKELTQQEAT